MICSSSAQNQHSAHVRSHCKIDIEIFKVAFSIWVQKEERKNLGKQQQQQQQQHNHHYYMTNVIETRMIHVPRHTIVNGTMLNGNITTKPS